MTPRNNSQPAVPAALSIRRLVATDIPVAHELRRLAGWNQTERDWAGYLEFEPEGCFAAEVGGRIVGTATTIRYGDRFGWVGMVLVHPEQRRGGLGTALLNAAINSLRERGVQCVKLDATPLGRKVYLPMGFQDEYELSRFEGVASPGAVDVGLAIVPFTHEIMTDVVAFDAEAFGAPRPAVVATLRRRHPELSFVSRDAAGVAGYIIAREGVNAVQVGPWSARDPATAWQLLGSVLRRVAGRQVFIDVLEPNHAAREQMARLGFKVQRSLTRMFAGENRHPGLPGRVFGISSPEKG